MSGTGGSLRGLKALVVVMGVVLVFGTVALMFVIVQRMGGVGEATVTRDVGLGQPAGTRILGVAGADRFLGVWVARPDGERVLLVDPRSGRLAGEIRVGE